MLYEKNLSLLAVLELMLYGAHLVAIPRPFQAFDACDAASFGRPEITEPAALQNPITYGNSSNII